jgi:hypothetical protein
MKGRITFDYSNNNGIIEIGGDARFESKWSGASGKTINAYRNPRSVQAVALAAEG